MIMDLLPMMEKSVQEMERASPEWAASPELAEAKQGLAEIRMLRDQNGRAAPKQRAGSKASLPFLTCISLVTETAKHERSTTHARSRMDLLPDCGVKICTFWPPGEDAIHEPAARPGSV